MAKVQIPSNVHYIYYAKTDTNLNNKSICSQTNCIFINKLNGNNLYDMINSARIQLHLPRYKRDLGIEYICRLHANDMKINNFLSHIGSVGDNIVDRFKMINRKGCSVAEVITVTKGFKKSEIKKSFKKALWNFFKSYKHKQILLSRKYKKVGIAYTYKNNKFWWVIDLSS